MLLQKNLFLYGIIFLLILGLSQTAWAVSPMWAYINLVAGESSAGHQDGAFNEATFNYPSGLAIDPTGNRLYVSDRDNNCIRMVDLEHQNEVSTLAGKTQAGCQDGPFETALFKAPTCMVLISQYLLVVNDPGNHRIRLLDLKNKTVTTLAGGAIKGPHEGPALQCSLGNIWSMAYADSQNSLYFSEPFQAAVQKLDLKSGSIHTVFQDRAEIPNPAALYIWQDKIFVADRNLDPVYHVVESVNSVVLDLVGHGKNILALTATKNGLYALQNDPTVPFKQLLPQDRPVNLVSAWGTTLPAGNEIAPCFEGIGSEDNIGLVENPLCPGSFYIAAPHHQCLFSFRDIFQDDFIATGPDGVLPSGLTDWAYPESKPPHTFRILVIGDSHIYHTFLEDQQKRGWKHDNLMDGLTKRLELELNTLASLDDNPVHFEVLTMARPGTTPLFLWPYYEAPHTAQKYDVDLVLYMFSPNMFTPSMFMGRTTNDMDFSFQSYFLGPLTSEGIPAQARDPESLLKPITEKMPGGLAGEFFKRCQDKKLARVGDRELWFADFNRLVSDPEIEKDLVQLIGKPIRMLHDKVGRMKTSAGQPVAFYLGILPVGEFFPMAAQKLFWNDLGNYTQSPLLDLTGDFSGLRPAWFPLSDRGEYVHFSSDGYFVEALVLAHELIQRKMIPWPQVQKSNSGN